VSAQAPAPAPETDAVAAGDPDLPTRLLEEVLSRPEFGNRITERSNPLADAIERLAAAWSRMPDWVDATLTGLVIATALALVLWLLADAGGVGRRRRRALAEEPGAAARSEGTSAAEVYRQGRAALAEGRHAEAIVLLFRAMILRLTERGLLLNDPSRTNREHLRDLRRREREARALRSAIPAFERVRYGRGEPAADEAAQALAAAQTLFPADAP
jgi:hypothetical protein